MPYSSIHELPDSVQHALPSHAQDIYKEAFNSAFGEYKTEKSRRGNSSREEVAHRVAWSAVKQKYSKGTNGNWQKKA